MSQHVGVDDAETCDCDRHGVQLATFVCNHIVGARHGETVGFVSGEPDDECDLRDAWCEKCHAYLTANGGEWVDGSVEVPGGISILCAECYRAREADAQHAGRRVLYRVS